MSPRNFFSGASSTLELTCGLQCVSQCSPLVDLIMVFGTLIACPFSSTTGEGQE